jgi:o-succinylbenzoate---CoA ligase
MRGAFGMTPGELLGVAMPPGEGWIDVVHRCWSERVAFMPIDVRLTATERRAIVDLARPTAVVDETGDVTAFGGAASVATDVATVVATSGTGGAPRLAELSRDAVQAAIDGSAHASGLAREMTWVCCLPPAHVGGLLVLLRAELGAARIAVLDRFDPDVIAGIAGAAVSVVPAMVARLAASDRRMAGSTLVVGGGPLDARLATEIEARGVRVVTTYGLTETCGGVVYDGVPFAGTEVRLDDDGWIEVRGPTLMEGYRGDPESTGAAFSTDGWLRTRDIGAFDGEGRLIVRGRVDEAIRTGGETVWPLEVERVLAAHPKIADVAVAGAPHTEWGQQVVAWVVPRSVDDPPTLEELRDLSRSELAGYKAPRRLELVSAIPRTASGKVRRGETSPGRSGPAGL